VSCCVYGDVEVEQVTSIADVVEEQLGIDLSPQAIPSFEKLSFSDLNGLRRALREHSGSPYLRLPSVEGTEICCVFHQNSPLTHTLGGAARRFGVAVDHSPEEMLGSLFLGLTYFPRIAVADGLQYFLDYFEYPEFFPNYIHKYKATVVNLLSFYSHVRGLIRNQDLVILPSSIWTEVHTAVAEAPPSREVFDQLMVEIKKPKYLPALRQAYEQEWGIEPAEALGEGLLGSLTFYSKLRALQELLTICDVARYTPVIEGVAHQLLFDVLVTLPEKPWGASARGAYQLVEQSVLVPLLGRVPVADFMAIRNGDAFHHFRSMIESIGEKANNLAGSPLDLKEMIAYELRQGKRAIDRETGVSGTLKEMIADFREIAIGSILGPAAVSVNPEWRDDPWKLILTAIATSGISFIHRFVSQAKSRSSDEVVSRIYSKLIQADRANSGSGRIPLE
jgi:hypothetical protein